MTKEKVTAKNRKVKWLQIQQLAENAQHSFNEAVQNIINASDDKKAEMELIIFGGRFLEHRDNFDKLMKAARDFLEQMSTNEETE